MDLDKPTVVDSQTTISGEMKGRDASVLGRFTGEIELTGRLVMGEGSRVEATVVADSAEIGGEFKGELKVRALVLLEKARVEGALETETLSIREGAQVNGPVSAGAVTARGAGSPMPVPPHV